jgi:cobalt transporter subunit CbtB
MTTLTQTTERVDSNVAGIVLTAFAGLTLVFLAGFAHASVAHDTAHDTRHAIAFPCH